MRRRLEQLDDPQAGGCPATTSSRWRTCRGSTSCPSRRPERAREVLDAAGRRQAQRRARHQHGPVRAEVAARGQAGHELPGRDRHPGARAARAARRPAAAGADELGVAPAGRRWRRCAATTGCASRTCRWTSCRAASRSCAPTTCSRWSGRPNPDLEWCPPGHGDLYTALAASGHPRRPARRRPALGVRVELGQPRRARRRADGRLGRRRAGAVRHGGGARHPGRPQGRPPRPLRDGPGGAARDRAGARGRHVVHRRRPVALLQHEQPVGRPAGAARAAGRRPGARRRCR